MIPVILTKVKTSDGITLDGIYVRPSRKGKTALIWLHGLTSNFYSSQALINELSFQCARVRIGYFKFNNRGHDIVVRGQGKNKLLGTLFERFEDSIHDIRATINFARRLGYKKIVLAGHSTGANKAVYYLYKTRDRNVKGVILLGAASDIVAETQRVGEGVFKKKVRLAKYLNKKSPLSFFTSNGFIYTAYRFLGLYTPGKAEDTFPYYNPSARWTAFKSIRQPVSMIMGSRDECLDRSAKKHIEMFREKALKTKRFSGFIIKGAGHNFIGKERELAREITRWIKRAIA